MANSKLKNYNERLIFCALEAYRNETIRTQKRIRTLKLSEEDMQELDNACSSQLAEIEAHAALCDSRITEAQKAAEKQEKCPELVE